MLLFLWAKHLGAQEDDMRQILADSRLFKASPVQMPVHAGQLCCETWKTNQEIQRVIFFNNTAEAVSDCSILLVLRIHFIDDIGDGQSSLIPVPGQTRFQFFHLDVSEISAGHR